MSALAIQSSDTPDQIKAAVEHAGYEMDAVEETTPEAAGESAGAEEDEDDEEDESASAAAAGEAAGKATEDGTAAATETAGKGEQEPPVQGKPKNVPGSKQEKAKRLVAEAENARLKAEIETLKQRPAGDAAGTPKPEKKTTETVAADTEPKWEDFENSDDQTKDYTVAHAKWAVREGFREERANQQKATVQDQAKADQDARALRWNEQQDVVRAKHADYDDAIKQNVFSEIMLDLLADFGGPDMAYQLGKHPEEALAIAKKTVPAKDASPAKIRELTLLATRELAKFEVKYLANEDTGESQTTSGTDGSQSTPPAQNRKVIPVTASPRPAGRAGGAAPASTGAVDYDKIAQSGSPIADFERAQQRKRA